MEPEDDLYRSAHRELYDRFGAGDRATELRVLLHLIEAVTGRVDPDATPDAAAERAEDDQALPDPPDLSDPVGDVAGEDVLAALVLLRHLRERIAAWEPELIAAARERGVSWVRLAPALGVASRQAAERRFLRLRPDGESTTAEQRVRAERDRRAGDRAVAAWAQRNAAVLRSLAGQVSAIDPVDVSSRHVVRRVHEALAVDDSTALLDPLAAMAAHLGSSHPELARKLTDVAAHSARARAAGHRRQAEGHDRD